ncbi:MAG TPA: dihydroorotase [Salinimicrobium sp.]|nr:dihydroorotase [Salinimicrobium sp.]
MKTLIKSAKIIDKGNDWNNKTVDILIEDGIIQKISDSIDIEADKTISCENLYVSKGWFDSSVSFGEPGHEERETIENGLLTAAKSGFTTILMNPNNTPATDNRGAISYIFSKASGNAVDLFPMGALTKNSEGKDLAELYDMQQAGAVAFGDYKKSIENPNLLKIALQYAQNFDALIQSFPQDNKIAGSGQVNENVNSTFLGLKGIPALAEELQIARDLYILEYTGGKLHIPGISTAKSVELIKAAKAKKLDVTCSVAIHHLLLTDDLLSDFDTRTKVLPPLRTQNDVEALKKGVSEGIIDMIMSDHDPIDIENKKVEFDNALPGTIGLESAFGALNNIFPLELTIELLTAGRERFGIESPIISEGKKANFTFFDPNENYVFSKNHIFSTSENSIFLNQELKGKVFGIFSKGMFVANQ